MKQFDVVVVGGGVVGLSAALAMAKRQYRVAILDVGGLRINTEEINPRVYAINQASSALLSELGVWPLLDSSRLCAYQHMEVWDAHSSGKIEFNAREVSLAYLGHIVEESLLKNALLECLNAYPNLSCFPHTRIEAITELEDGLLIASSDQKWQGTLSIIADGGESTSRQLLGVPLKRWSYHQKAIVVTVRTEKAHNRTAYQVFNREGTLAFLPLADAHSCSIVWVQQPHTSDRLMQISVPLFEKELTNAFEEKLGSVQITGERTQFPLWMRHAETYVGAHWLLMGDAAHTVHPLAGLGLNLGLEDVRSWMDYSAKNRIFSQRALNAYQRKRKHAVWQIILLLEALKHLFLSPFRPIRQLRGLGLRSCNQMRLLKQQFIKFAQGRN